MIVWGGHNGGSRLNTGGRYDPNTDSWTATSTTNAPDARYFHTVVWTDSEMIVWGGADNNGNVVNTGGRYNPVTDSWIATSTTNAPDVRYSHTAVWTGSEMIVWGGLTGYPPQFINTGGRYNPGTDSWVATTTTNAPSGRAPCPAVWTGSEMIVWGGTADTTGGRYCAAGPSPTPTPTPSPTPTATATATATATPTATASSTPRSQPTPRPRPTPVPRP